MEGPGILWKVPSPPRSTDSEEGDEQDSLGACFKDAEYIYPSLESDEDDPALKSLPKRKKATDDAPWSPKARVTPSLPRQSRPVREGTRVASVETGLAAAAAKLAQQGSAPRRAWPRPSSAWAASSRSTATASCCSEGGATGKRHAPFVGVVTAKTTPTARRFHPGHALPPRFFLFPPEGAGRCVSHAPLSLPRPSSPLSLQVL